MPEHAPDNPRRDFLRKTLTLIPVVTVASTGLGFGAGQLSAAPVREPRVPATPPPSQYQPTFFTAEEWAFLQAAVSRIIPADDLGPGALEAGAAEFIDRQMNTPYATGAQWYMQGPFKADAAPELGYQLQLSPQQIYRLGIAAAQAWCKTTTGKTFDAQDSATRDHVLRKIESGEAVFEQVPAKVFFSLLVQNTREGFFCDPIHGGNRGMVGWTQIGFPGARADFMDWVERNEPYPFPAVSIRGERA
ncbi:gluconate 2-dehydrogenase subunit 3 family protein [Pseudomonas vanderleydeniana]|uniref:Gluconate 2-dehydrogenase subunit 3 family protein n=1 Tax=Pseudomonas vanderleydeniana TaxID=2745495 RepID=A0A9E6PRL4_9PSED|nr:gluconate 2-dehydrogenase subunit 3 family protein [Pseudomonas vanderleydeniana]QXI30955.1 gluconate 2-dehydrogenase subunit 3 family protein [Pseudomonas vanderleydeniana]